MKNIKSYLGDYDDVSSIKILGNNTLKKPEITVAIPTYKRSFFLNLAIRSILNQKKILFTFQNVSWYNYNGVGFCIYAFRKC